MQIKSGTKCGLHVKLPYQQKWFGREELEIIVQGEVIRTNWEKGFFAIQFFNDYQLKTLMYNS